MRKHYFGASIEKVTDGFTIGSCIAFDKYLKELYVFITVGLWCISIGWLSKEITED